MDDDDYEVLQGIRRELQARHDEWYAAFDRARGDSRVTRDELAARHEQLIAEFEQVRSVHGHRFDKIDTEIEHDRRVNREILLDIRQISEENRDIRHGTQAMVEGLLHVLDEFRRDDGPSGAGA